MDRNHDRPRHTPNAPFSGERLGLSAFPFPSLQGKREAIRLGRGNAPWPPLTIAGSSVSESEQRAL